MRIVPPCTGSVPVVVLLMLAFATCGNCLSAADVGTRPINRRATVERMTKKHLEATHNDVLRIKESRRKLSTRTGLTDIRAILHSHAEDSAHTGGTRPEMLADAKRVGVNAILLTDHHRPPKDFITDSWRGDYEGVLFIPGSEAKGFLLYPMGSIMSQMELPNPAFIDTVARDRGLIFLSHIEERPDHSMEGLHGMEIYNRHADAKKDAVGILNLLLRMTDPESLKELEESLEQFPDELLGFQLSYPDDYLAKWDAETKTRRLTGVAANDCHHNQILIMKMTDEGSVRIGTNVDADDKYRSFNALLRPGIRQLTKGHQSGDVLARLDLDPYYRSFLNVCTHIFVTELNESAVRMALREGHAYVSHDWMCDPTGFTFQLSTLAKPISDDLSKNVISGDEVTWEPGMELRAELPVACRLRLLNSGKVILDVDGNELRQPVKEPGVYRLEAWLKTDGEDRPWIYSNPIYVR